MHAYAQTIHTTGDHGSADYAVYLFANGKRVSSWHDVPLLPSDGGPAGVIHYVNEIPYGTRRKFETQTKLEHNPIKQDSKNGVLREYTYGNTFFNYGGIPQTWEDPHVTDADTGAGGDNDPVDVMELSKTPRLVGEVVTVKVLGALALLDQNEVDWKVLAIAVDDERAARWNNIGDIDSDLMERVRDWLINYKTTDGKPKNVLADKPLDRAAAIRVISECHEQWRALRAWARPPQKLWTGTGLDSAMVPLHTLVSLGASLLEQAGAEIGRIHTAKQLNTKAKGKTAEGVITPLTQADVSSHKLITDTLKSFWPGISLVSEEDDPAEAEVEAPELGPVSLDRFAPEHDEQGVSVPLSDVTIWVDPLDATKEFTEDMLQYITVMLCVAVRGEPVAGIVYQPFARDTTERPDVDAVPGEPGRLAWAIKHPTIRQTPWYGGFDATAATGARRPPGGGEPIRVAVSRSHPGELKAPIEAVGGEMRAAGGAGYKTLMLLDGEADLYLHRTRIQKWDVCAADAILTARGGGFVTWEGTELRYASGNPTDYVNAKGLLGALDAADLSKYVEKLRGIKL